MPIRRSLQERVRRFGVELRGSESGRVYRRPTYRTRSDRQPSGSTGRARPAGSRPAAEGAYNPGAFRAGNIRPSGCAGRADRTQSWPATHQHCLGEETRAYRSSVGTIAVENQLQTVRFTRTLLVVLA